MNVEMTVNGKKVKADTPPSLLLSDFLRENLNLTGTHVGCDTSQCGACVVHIDGVSMKSCTLLAVTVGGKSVTTIEGLAKTADADLHPMQLAFHHNHGLQCGFCTPGMIMNVHTGIGASILRKEDRRFITGKGNYVADIKRPDMAMGVFLRSPHAHALIKSIDTKAAAALPGVAAIYVGADLAADKIGGLPCAWGVSNADGTPMKEPPRSAMAVDKVRCVGDAVAFVIADTVEQAREAA